MPGAKSNMNVQAVTHAEGYSQKLYSHGGIKPAFVDHQRGVGHAPAPLFHYRGADVLEMLHSLRGEKGDPHEGIKVDFVNPVTGEPVFKTLNYSAQLLRADLFSVRRRADAQYRPVLRARPGQGWQGHRTHGALAKRATIVIASEAKQSRSSLRTGLLRRYRSSQRRTTPPPSAS
jgi:gentisate 1,2-dioxygenase